MTTEEAILSANVPIWLFIIEIDGVKHLSMRCLN